LPGPFSHPQRPGDGGQHELGIPQRREIDKDDAIRERALQPGSDLQGEAGLARATGAGQGDQPHVALRQQGDQLSQVLLSAEERGEGQRQRDGGSEGRAVRLRNGTGTGGGQEGFPVFRGQREGIGEQAHGAQVRCPARTALQIAEPPQAHPGPLGQLLL
jgi:hypothetical protein